MTAPAADLALLEMPTGGLRLAIANLRATANHAGCTGCRSASLRDCQAAGQPCCDECAHPLSADDVRHAADELAQALEAEIAKEAS